MMKKNLQRFSGIRSDRPQGHKMIIEGNSFNSFEIKDFEN
jgi:hypothetical protein